MWRQTDFLKLWAGQTVSLFGTQVSQLALPLVAVIMLGASASEMGLLRALEYAPSLLALPVGALVDRRRRRPLLIATNLFQALVLATVPVAAIAGVLSIGHLYVVAVLAGALAMGFSVAYGAYLPSLVAPEYLVEGNSRLEVSRSGARAGGPALAGVLIQVFTAPLAIVADALSFIVSAACLALIRQTERTRDSTAGRTLRADILEGLLVLRHPLLRAATVASALWNFFSGGMFDTLYVLYLVRDLGLSPVQVATLFTIVGIAGVGGALVTHRILRRIGLGPGLIAGTAVAASGYFVVPLVSGTPDQVLVVLGVMSAAIGVYQSLLIVGLGSIRQGFAPEATRGRAMASMYFFMVGVVPAGAVIGGVLGEALGARAALLIVALGLLLVPASLLISPVRALRTLPVAA